MQKKIGIKVLVTAVGAEPGRNVVRALDGNKGIEVIAADSDPLAPALYDTDEMCGSYLLPRAKDEEAYIAGVTEIVKKEGVNVILPCIEDEVFALSRNKEHFSKTGVSVICPEYEKVRMMTDKKTMADAACQVNIPTPRTYLLKDYVEGAGDLDFPLIVKPRIGRGAKNVLIIKNKEDMDRARAHLSKCMKDYVIQPYISGKTGSIFLCGLLYGKTGKVIAEFLSRSLKTLFDFGGSAMCGEPVKGFERLKDYSKALMGHIGGWYGPVNIEYKISSQDGLPYILEVNPRFWGYGLLAVKSGINFPYLAVMDAIGRKCGPVKSYRDDMILLREFKDTVIPKSDIKKNLWDKVICVCEVNSPDKKLVTNVNRLLKLDEFDKVVLTGKKELLDAFAKNFENNDRVSCYVMQANPRENLYEIGLYNFAEVLVHMQRPEDYIDVKEIQRKVRAFLKDKDRASCADHVYFRIMRHGNR